MASFIGQGYFIRGQLLSPESVQTELGILRGNRAYTWPTGGAVDVLLRPDDIVYAPDSDLKARIIGKTFLGVVHPVPPATAHWQPVGIDFSRAMPITSPAQTLVFA